MNSIATSSASSPPPPPPIEPSSGPSSGGGCGWKIPGCLLGCLIAAGVVILAVVGAAWWFLGPGTQHPTEAAVGPESSGALQVRDLGADPGTREALEEVVREARRRAPARPDGENGLPGWLPVSGSGAQAGAIAKVLPREGTLSFERVAGRDEPAAVLVLNLRGFTRPLRMMLESEDAGTELYRGVAVASPEGGDVLFAMVDGTLVMADDRGALQAAIDRLLDGTGQPMASRMEVLERPPEGALLSGGVGFAPGELAAMARSRSERKSTHDSPPIDPARLEGVRRVELMVDGIDPRAVRFRIGVGTDSPGSADRAADAFADLVRSRLAPATATVTRSRAADSSGAVLDVELTDWIGPVAAWLVRGSEGEAVAPPPTGEDGWR